LSEIIPLLISYHVPDGTWEDFRFGTITTLGAILEWLAAANVTKGPVMLAGDRSLGWSTVSFA
jgi:hypothetical protein